MEGLSSDEAKKQNFNYQKIVFLVGISLMIMKFIAWMLTYSVSILTDALESIVNVVAAAIGLYALYLSSKPRDESHPFGHGKVENISSLIEGSMICAAGAIIILQAVERIINPMEITSLDIGLALIALTALINFIMGYYAIAKGKRNRSPALVASGKHLCSDTVSSVGIILGLFLMMALDGMGFDAYWIDGAVAAVFGLIIIFTGIRVVVSSMQSSMDAADVGIVKNILDTINDSRHSDWIDIHNLRVIRYGPLLHVQMHIVLPKSMTVEEQFTEFSELKDSIYRIYGDSVDLLMMGEPCTGAFCCHCDRDCPCRSHVFESRVEWTLETISEESSSIE